jgi:endonuclease-8
VPEGDTVWLTAKHLRDALSGDVLTHTEFRVPQLATTTLTGRTVNDVLARGKHILMRVDGDLTLHSHLRLDGSWRLGKGRLPKYGPPHQIRAILRTQSWMAAGYRVHDLAVVPTDHEHTLVGHLGPDLLGRDWDEDEAVRRITAQPHREIGDALLDQRNLAGIGNMYKAELLFLSGISPWTRVDAVADVPGVVRRAQRLLRANRDRWEQVTTGVNRKGEQLWVFERRGEPCRRCRTPIRMDMQGEPPYDRMTYWCPACQPGIGPGVP